VTLPQEAVSALGLHTGARLDVHVADGQIILRPVAGAPSQDEDAWAYSEQHLAAVERSGGQRGYRLGPADLDRLIREAEEARREGREYRVTTADLEAIEAAHGGPRPD
jgi:antitoxin component of MazEF toxin-antitoxin module